MQTISTSRVFKAGERITYRKKLTGLGPTGALYAVVNTNSVNPPIGAFHIPPSGLTLRINAVDADLIDRTQQIASLSVGDVVSFHTTSTGPAVAATVLNSTPILNTGVFALFITILPVVTDGTYFIKVKKA